MNRVVVVMKNRLRLEIGNMALVSSFGVVVARGREMGRWRRLPDKKLHCK